MPPITGSEETAASCAFVHVFSPRSELFSAHYKHSGWQMWKIIILEKNTFEGFYFGP